MQCWYFYNLKYTFMFLCFPQCSQPQVIKAKIPVIILPSGLSSAITFLCAITIDEQKWAYLIQAPWEQRKRLENPCEGATPVLNTSKWSLIKSWWLQNWENIAGHGCYLNSVYLLWNYLVLEWVWACCKCDSRGLRRCDRMLIILFFSFLRPEISEELRTLILRMLDKNPDTRITLSEIKVRSEQTQARPGQARPWFTGGHMRLCFSLIGWEVSDLDDEADNTVAVKKTEMVLKNFIGKSETKKTKTSFFI